MPLMIIRTSVSIPEAKKEELLKGATKVLVDAGKAESHVMVLLEKVDASMGGKVEPAACVEVRSMVGLTHEFNHKISEGICALLEKMLGISGHNIYLNFIPVSEGAWGWDRGITVYNYAQKKWVID
jgi:phenylpyruvate tautomerase PptA (4-oxalocrotonate tautomerase family)